MATRAGGKGEPSGRTTALPGLSIFRKHCFAGMDREAITDEKCSQCQSAPEPDSSGQEHEKLPLALWEFIANESS